MSQTACPHCGSTNSIETAGQNYCADCGQLISAHKTTKKAPEKVSEKTTEKVVAKTIKPEAARSQVKSAQQTKAVTHQAPQRPRKSAPPLNLKAIEESRSPKASAANHPSALDLRNTSAKPAIKKPVGKHVAPVKKVQQPSDAKPVIAEAAITAIHVPVPARKFRHKLALRDAFKSVAVGKTLRIALVATVITTLCEAAFVALFAKSGAYAVSESLKAGSINAARLETLVGHAAWGALFGFVGYLVYHYGLAEIIFRTSRTFDRRSASDGQARRAALGSLAGLFAIDVITWLLAAGSIALVAGANFGFLGTKSLGIVGVILAGLVNLVAAYLWLGLISARRMATYAIVLGQVGVRRAYGAGWALYNRQFGRITTGLVIMAIINTILAAPTVLLNTRIDATTGLSLAAVTALAALTQAIVMIISSIYFLRLYRYVIAREYDSDLGHLLSGRQPRHSHVVRRLVVLGIIAIIWVAGMTSLILSSSSVASAIIH